MTPSYSGIAAALAKYLTRRAIVRQVDGPFGGEGATYRVSLVNGSRYEIRVKPIEAA